MLTTGTRKVALAVGLTVVVVTTGYFVLDINTAALKNEAPTVLQRMDEAAYGANTRHMDTRGKAVFLIENCNLEAKDLSVGGRFDNMKVNHEYRRVEESKFLTAEQLDALANKECELEQKEHSLVEREARLAAREAAVAEKTKFIAEGLDVVEGKESSPID